MRIRISDISPEGLKVVGALGLEAINARMDLAKNNEIHFTSAPQVNVVVHKVYGGAEVKGEVQFGFSQPCGLCSEVISRKGKIAVSFVLRERPEGITALECEDDIGLYYFAEDHFDLEPALQEEIIITLDPYWHGETERRAGAEHVCAPLEQKREVVEIKAATQNLGDLLKQATSKKVH